MGFGVEDFGTPGAVETKFSLRLIYTQYIPKLIYLLTYSMVAALPLPFEEWQGWGRNGDGGGYVEKKSFLSELYIPYTSITRVYTLSKLLTDLTKWVLVFPIQGGDPPTPPQPQPPPLQIYTWETYYNFMVLAVYECVSGIFMHWQNTDQIAVYQWKKKLCRFQQIIWKNLISGPLIHYKHWLNVLKDMPCFTQQYTMTTYIYLHDCNNCTFAMHTCCLDFQDIVNYA